MSLLILKSPVTTAITCASAANASNLTIVGRKLEPRVKAFGVFNALGAIAFAYSFSAVLLEVQVGLECKMRDGGLL
jgi:hypothetical protein